jgi:hypothetical protein
MALHEIRKNVKTKKIIIYLSTIWETLQRFREGKNMKNLLQFKKNIHIDPYSSKSKILKEVLNSGWGHTKYFNAR